MASSAAKPQATNLAALLSIKRKMAEKNEGSSDAKQLQPPPSTVTGAHSNEKISYRQDAPVSNSPGTTASNAPANSTDQTKVSRKKKQLEVEQFDKNWKKLTEKQEEKTNEALDTWKGFDSLNYGLAATPNARNPTPPPPEATKQQRTLTPPPKKPSSPARQPSPAKPRTPSSKRIDSPVKDQPKPKSPLKQEKHQEKTPPHNEEKPTERRKSSPPPREEQPTERRKSSPPPREEKPIERRTPTPPSHAEKSINRRTPTPPPREQKPIKRRTPTPPPREEKPIERRQSSPPLPPVRHSKVKSPEHEQPISHPQISERRSQPLNRPSVPMSTTPHLKIFPDIQHNELRKSRHALKSIQRSMDRYRFHVW